MPDGPWRFDDGVVAVFDDMMARSIPQYSLMRDLCVRLGSALVQPGTAIVDLGCARGGALVPFVERFGTANQFLGVDSSDAMIAAAREQFPPGAYPHVRLEVQDLGTAYPEAVASLTLCVLTLQFVPVSRRAGVLATAFHQTAPGGALMFVEKLKGGTPEMDALLAREYRSFKLAQGYSAAAVDAKEKALEGILVPVTAADNEQLLSAAGFQAECVWRCLNFGAWLAVKAY